MTSSPNTPTGAAGASLSSNAAASVARTTSGSSPPSASHARSRSACHRLAYRRTPASSRDTSAAPQSQPPPSRRRPSRSQRRILALLSRSVGAAIAASSISGWARCRGSLDVGKTCVGKFHYPLERRRHASAPAPPLLELQGSPQLVKWRLALKFLNRELTSSAAHRGVVANWAETGGDA